jgi:hypothetical protein
MPVFKYLSFIGSTLVSGHSATLIVAITGRRTSRPQPEDVAQSFAAIAAKYRFHRAGSCRPVRKISVDGGPSPLAYAGSRIITVL